MARPTTLPVAATLLLALALFAPPCHGKPRRKAGSPLPAGPVDESVVQRGLMGLGALKYKSILMENGQFHKETSTRRFTAGPTLGYVTPWNSEGYKVAKMFRGKFTHISPVWYQIRPTTEKTENPQDGGRQYQSGVSHGPPKLTGGHDADLGWVSDVRGGAAANASSGGPYAGAKVVPRVLFEGWGATDYIYLLTGKADGRDYWKDDVTDEFARLAARTIVDECEEKGYDGIVLEVWAQWSYIGLLDHQPLLDACANFIEVLGAALRNATAPSGEPMELILAVPPSEPSLPGKAPTFTSEHLELLSPHIHSVSAMTYDGASPEAPGPNADIRWVRRAVEGVLGENGAALGGQVLVGLNFYGNDYNIPKGGGAIVGHEYRGVLERAKPKDIRWLEEEREHVFEYDGDGGQRRRVYFPTLQSIQARLDLASELGVGIAIWEIGQGLLYFYDLL
mmetsp:Transcript_26856/g.86235  ORF Transcript_26856/g.86235 Transcript_26856/m.86235 type:complete len:451 (-) Transcript_26856:768-2120(-)